MRTINPAMPVFVLGGVCSAFMVTLVGAFVAFVLWMLASIARP